MDEPLVGTPQQNYRFFYGASLSAIISLVVLFVITGYTAYTASEINEVIKDNTICGLSTDFFKAFGAMREMCVNYSIPLSDILVVTDMHVTDSGLFGHNGKTWVEKVRQLSEEHNMNYPPKRNEGRGPGCFVLNCQNNKQKPCNEDCDGIAYCNITQTDKGFPSTGPALRAIGEFCNSRYKKKVTPFSNMANELAVYIEELENELGGPIPIFGKMRVCSLKDKIIAMLMCLRKRDSLGSKSISNINEIVRYICNLSASWIDF